MSLLREITVTRSIWRPRSESGGSPKKEKAEATTPKLIWRLIKQILLCSCGSADHTQGLVCAAQTLYLGHLSVCAALTLGYDFLLIILFFVFKNERFSRV